jgi:hypothetical protein
MTLRLRILNILFGVLLIVAASGCAKEGDPRSKPELNPTQTLVMVQDSLVRNFKMIERWIAEAQKNPQASHDALIAIGIANQDSMAQVATLGTVGDGIAAMQKRNDGLEKQADTSRQPFYRRLESISIISGIVLTLGICVAVMSIIRGNPPGTAIGAGLSALGVSGIAVFMLMRSAAPALPYLFWGGVVIVLLAFGYFVYERIEARRERISRERKLADEQVATREIVKTVDEVRKQLDPVTDDRLFGGDGVVAQIQTPPTVALVKEAKRKMIAERLGST